MPADNNPPARAIVRTMGDDWYVCFYIGTFEVVVPCLDYEHARMVCDAYNARSEEDAKN